MLGYHSPFTLLCVKITENTKLNLVILQNQILSKIWAISRFWIQCDDHTSCFPLNPALISILGLLHHVDVGDVAAISEVYAVSIFRAKMWRLVSVSICIAAHSLIPISSTCDWQKCIADIRYPCLVPS